MDEQYLAPVFSGRWAISRKISGRNIYLIQNTKMDSEKDIPIILQALGIELTPQNLDLFFPKQKNRGRCPTIDLLELFACFDKPKRENQKESGV